MINHLKYWSWIQKKKPSRLKNGFGKLKWRRMMKILKNMKKEEQNSTKSSSTLKTFSLPFMIFKLFLSLSTMPFKLGMSKKTAEKVMKNFKSFARVTIIKATISSNNTHALSRKLAKKTLIKCISCKQKSKLFHCSLTVI